MLRSALELTGYPLEATDGEIGTVADFLFDDHLWTVRYLVADTGKWLPGRKVLLAPEALGRPEWSAGKFPVELTRRQIESSPSLARDKPVSRQHETALREHYDWTMYWSGSAALHSFPAAVARSEMARQRRDSDPNLRSLREVSGYRIAASDGEIGHVEDLILDTDSWWLPYVVVDTRNWLPGRKVLLSPSWFREFRWADQRAAVDLTRDAIRYAPEFDPKAPVNRDYEERLYDYYGRPAYWAPTFTGRR